MNTQKKTTPKPPTPKRVKPSIRLDAVHPSDLLKYDFRYACEHCSHFDRASESCTLGYVSRHHRKAEMDRSYNVCGKMALCRFLEID